MRTGEKDEEVKKLKLKLKKDDLGSRKCQDKGKIRERDSVGLLIGWRECTQTFGGR